MIGCSARFADVEGLLFSERRPNIVLRVPEGGRTDRARNNFMLATENRYSADQIQVLDADHLACITASLQGSKRERHLPLERVEVAREPFERGGPRFRTQGSISRGHRRR
jgi:hypothetical protein